MTILLGILIPVVILLYGYRMYTKKQKLRIDNNYWEHTLRYFRWEDLFSQGTQRFFIKAKACDFVTVKIGDRHKKAVFELHSLPAEPIYKDDNVYTVNVEVHCDNTNTKCRGELEVKSRGNHLSYVKLKSHLLTIDTENSNKLFFVKEKCYGNR